MLIILLLLFQFVFTKEDYCLIEPIKIVGNKFFTSDSEFQFFIKGIAYQKSRQEGEFYDNTKEPNYIDSLANPFSCLRDLEYLKELRVNVIRVYQISPTSNHDVCMNAFAKEGIYVLADLSEPYLSIRRDNPSWDTDLFTRYKEVIDSMAKYNNVLGFIAGNEVANSIDTIDSSPFIRASIRDCKSYIEEQGYRKIPVGYASNDDTNIRNHLANYLVCDLENDNNYSKSDFFAINVYEWCGYSTYTTSGYRELTNSFENYSAPIFFAEFGCNIINPRPFTEIEAIYGTKMSKIWSGAIAYEYFEEANHYGIVMLKKDGQLTKLPDFEHLKKNYEDAKPIGSDIDECYQLETTSCSCPNNENFQVATNLPPTPVQGKCECLWQSFGCVVIDDGGFDEEPLIQDLCKKVDCQEIKANGNTGKYGKYSHCNPIVRASYALNKFYEQCGKNENVCLAQGRGQIVKNVLSLRNKYSSDGRNCQALLFEEDEEEEEIEQPPPKKKIIKKVTRFPFSG
ncbi:unnamed protein product [Candida verbasci]|uniref:1,3-beta-glucanosyltransferase n=1 Tax=Candida verbasci TaxID=1227364 RepID=A0A9W4XB13_9ASCO|nr:unnamed protein product [Candida verbasci]